MQVAPSLLPLDRLALPAVGVAGQQDFQRLSEARLARPVAADDHRQSRTGFQFQFGRRTDASETFHFDRRQVGSGRFDGLTRRFGGDRPGYLSSFESGRQRIFPTQRRQHQVDDLLIQGSFSECRQRLVDQAHRPSSMCFPEPDSIR